MQDSESIQGETAGWFSMVAANIKQNLKSGDQNAITQFLGNITNKALTSASNSALGLQQLTKEDKETTDKYKVAVQQSWKRDQNIGLNLYQQKSDNAGSASLEHMEEQAWVYADLNFSLGLITFEEQKVWQTMYDQAKRGLRDIYFDFAPKLAPDQGTTSSFTTSKPWIAADAIAIKEANYQLPDIHPNIGILKYRLTPAFLPYRVNNANSEFFFYTIYDKDTLTYTTGESEETVYTIAFGYGDVFSDNPVTQAQNTAAYLQGLNRGMFAIATFC